jgi:hypothetical protein
LIISTGDFFGIIELKNRAEYNYMTLICNSNKAEVLQCDKNKFLTLSDKFLSKIFDYAAEKEKYLKERIYEIRNIKFVKENKNKYHELFIEKTNLRAKSQIHTARDSNNLNGSFFQNKDPENLKTITASKKKNSGMIFNRIVSGNCNSKTLQNLKNLKSLKATPPTTFEREDRRGMTEYNSNTNYCFTNFNTNELISSDCTENGDMENCFDDRKNILQNRYVTNKNDLSKSKLRLTSAITNFTSEPNNILSTKNTKKPHRVTTAQSENIKVQTNLTIERNTMNLDSCKSSKQVPKSANIFNHHANYNGKLTNFNTTESSRFYPRVTTPSASSSILFENSKKNFNKCFEVNKNFFLKNNPSIISTKLTDYFFGCQLPVKKTKLLD